MHCNRNLLGSYLQVGLAGCTWGLCQHQPTQSNRIPWAGFRDHCLGWPMLCRGGEGRYGGTGSTGDTADTSLAELSPLPSPSFPSLCAVTPTPHLHTHYPKVAGQPWLLASSFAETCPECPDCSIQPLSSAHSLPHHLLLNIFC